MHALEFYLASKLRINIRGQLLDLNSPQSFTKTMRKIDDYKPALAMIGLQFIYAGVTLLTRAALLKGLSSRVFVVYRLAITTLIFAPIAFASWRKNPSRCSLGRKTFAWILLASLFGVTANQSTYFEGLYLSTSTAASAMMNLIPAITFVMTASLGLEKVSIRSLATLVKILGTLICVGGAIFMTLFKGPKLQSAVLLSPKTSLFSPGGETWLLGCLLLLGSCFFWALWLVLQVPVLVSCPDHIYASFWMCFLATLESAMVLFSVEKDLNAWRLNSYLELSCCLFTGIAFAVCTFVQAWCITRRGPLFPALFDPLCTVIVTIFSAIFLHEETYTGSLVGGLAVIIGLYIVLWGKAKDLEEMKQEKDPNLLNNDQTKIVQVIIDKSSEKTYKIDLEEPLVPDKSTKDDDCIRK